MSGPTKFMIKRARKSGKRYGIKPSDLLDVIEHESSFNPGAVSSAGAFGLSQFIPSTASQYGVKRGTSKHAQKTQIRGEAKYLHDLGYGKGTPSQVTHALAGYYGAASPYASEVVSSHKYEKYDKGTIKLAAGKHAKDKHDTISTFDTQGTTRKVKSAPAQSFAAERVQATMDFLNTENKDTADYVSFISSMQQLKDQPAQYDTVKGTRAVKTGTKKLPSGGKSKEVQAATGKAKQLKGNPKKAIVQVGKLAEKKFGLNVGENPHFGGVAPVHVTGSYHYQARAIDVSGSTKTMEKFAHYMAKKYGPKLTELFWQGPGGINYKNGDKVPQGYVSDHTDHVHVAF